MNLHRLKIQLIVTMLHALRFKKLIIGFDWFCSFYEIMLGISTCAKQLFFYFRIYFIDKFIINLYLLLDKQYISYNVYWY